MRKLNVQRLVVKVGTSSLILANGKLNLRAIARLAYVLTDLCNRGLEVILVSSGAIGAGRGVLDLGERPTTIPDQQALAAIGQSRLIGIYTREFAEYQQVCAQVLMTRDVISFPVSHQNVVNTLNAMLRRHVIPIVNENDTVSVDELDHKTSFSDNDELSAIVAELVQADLLIVLSDIDGLFTANPKKDPQAYLISTVAVIDATISGYAGGRGSSFGTGGMVTKLRAAQRILRNQQQMILANGADPEIIFDILDGQEVGTLFKNEKGAN
ncbi:glutamate 5-kinase [Lapidilactobacillus luobeiensis]|uniref:glutamate 5-kinase n=1 Tax=Lapidilactobacillus luobeiensis TaxID=2950371 RepID=UPI0021C2F8AE|nr:glutamate 5-kinase [Lapidilactobacillus luobeiensis]